MATTYNVPSFTHPAINVRGFPGVIERTYSADLEAVTGDASYALVIGDVFKFFKLPANARLSYARLEAPVDLDDGATDMTADVIVTDGTTTWALMDEAVIGAVGIWDTRDAATTTTAKINTIGKVTTNSNFYAAVRIGAVGATGDAATGAKIVLTIGYVLSLEDGQNAL